MKGDSSSEIVFYNEFFANVAQSIIYIIVSSLSPLI